MITLVDVSKSYGDVHALGPVDLEIPTGGVTALVGPNGAGKSTMLTIVGRLLAADAGRVTVGGLDVVTARPRELAQRLAILRQENHFVARLTVRQLVALGRFPHSQGRLTTADADAVDTALEFLDLVDLQHRYLDELSGGQRQRAYVAMVVAQDTDYLLLDEPLNNLDMQHAVSMMARLRRAADELGKTVVLVVHDVNFAAAWADRVVAMTDGRVRHVGTPAQIMTEEILTDVFATPVTVVDGPGHPLAVYYRP
ncbi:iron ABC transporter ATP-binding protein [Cellulomonas wangsupingiae]|uniref:ATP-binding cassette domain-containing protein n=1 Tax=Cellulomonas wangsupingiae TaxID=2968085 RepID=A0ABY5K3P2_9CELL|nr:ATP-binding cassette domain-containing protein [Cellulomonas wangsupingiae]MCC2335442.1 ATP-binding cassette domain-containing protein [Cellulomonas wangsupingiae]MCM0640027.1 ATP-binding cassette domain-containing protein [Cellulomonas wangsupingiae]UUI64383.1 ATP-binding cassette domain-containing protein [Cellulomonas wangsupingiae]